MPDPREFIDLLARFPVLLVLLCGLVFGGGFTQLIKKTYLAFSPHAVSDGRYRASVRWLAAVSTYGFTVLMWHAVLGHLPYDEIVCVGTAFSAPLCYDLLKAGLRWKWPQLVQGWGDDD